MGIRMRKEENIQRFKPVANPPYFRSGYFTNKSADQSHCNKVLFSMSRSQTLSSKSSKYKGKRQVIVFDENVSPDSLVCESFKFSMTYGSRWLCPFMCCKPFRNIWGHKAATRTAGLYQMTAEVTCRVSTTLVINGFIGST
jgi:hypothetical protein